MIEQLNLGTKDLSGKILNVLILTSKQIKPFENIINSYMQDCFGPSDYIDLSSNIYDNTLWYFAKRKSDSKILGFLMIDNDNMIWNVCTHSLFRGKGVASKLMNTVVETVCQNGKTPKLMVNKMLPTHNKLIKYYKKLGFLVNKKEEKFTEMFYPCKVPSRKRYPKNTYIWLKNELRKHKIKGRSKLTTKSQMCKNKSQKVVEVLHFEAQAPLMCTPRRPFGAQLLQTLKHMSLLGSRFSAAASGKQAEGMEQ